MAVPSQQPAGMRAEFGNWLREQRKALGKTQENIAEETGLSRLQILRIENGQSGTTEESLPKLALAVGISTAEIHRRYFGDRSVIKPDEELTLIVNTIPEPKRPKFVHAIREFAAIFQ